MCLKETKLKKCPFCGREAFIRKKCHVADCKEDCDCEECSYSSFRVICDFHYGGCGASGGNRGTKQEAIDAWNSRVVEGKEKEKCKLNSNGYCELSLEPCYDECMVVIPKTYGADERKTDRCRVSIKKLNEHAIVPTNGSEKAAGFDLYACLEEMVYIPKGATVKIGTGIAIAIPDGYYGAIFARSGLATKSGLRPANCVGVVDSDYRGEIIVALHNDSNEGRYVESGERIAQLVVTPYLPIDLYEVDELDETARGTGGFGSTGK